MIRELAGGDNVGPGRLCACGSLAEWCSKAVPEGAGTLYKTRWVGNRKGGRERVETKTKKYGAEPASGSSMDPGHSSPAVQHYPLRWDGGSTWV